MDEFEIFKARATGCEIHVDDSDPSEIPHRSSPRESLKSEGFSEEGRRSGRRKSLRKSSHRKHEDDREGSLQVKVEIQPPSPVACRKLSEQLHGSNQLTSIENKYSSNGSSAHNKSSHSRKLSADFKVEETRENIFGTPNFDTRRRSRHSFTGSCHGNESLQTDEFVKDFSDKEEEEELRFQRSKSCRNTSFNHRKSKQFANLLHDQSHRRSSEISNGCRDDDEDSLTQPTVYRVRSFTTKKGEIISRGDSFKVCGNRQQFLLVDQRSPSQRRCSAAVSGGSYSRLEVCTQGDNLRRSSLTCLAANQLTPVARRNSSERRRSSKIDVANDNKRKQSVISKRDSFSQEPSIISSQELVERWSNKSNEATDEGQCCVTEDIDLQHHPPPQVYHVSVLGSPGVGKTTLINQLMTSEYLANKEQTDQGDDDVEMVVSVVLDGIESTVHFLEGPASDDDQLPDAYLLVFSVTERMSLSFIQTCLHDIIRHDQRFQVGSHRKIPLKLRFNRQKSPPTSDQQGKQQSLDDVEENKPLKPVLYLVGNKEDLVRNRVVSEADVKRLIEVKKNRCKYAEASALLDHKVDEILVDIVREIRRRANRPEQEDSDVEDISGRGCLQQAMVGFCGKLFK